MGVFDGMKNVVKDVTKKIENDTKKEVKKNEVKKEIKETKVYYKVVTNTSNLNLRKTPSANGTIIGSMPKGTLVLLIDDSNDEWYKVRYEDEDIDGYASSKYLQRQ